MWLTLLRYAGPYLAAVLLGIYIGYSWFGCETKVDAELPATLITETNTITKVIKDAKDSCARQRMPSALIDKLRE